MSRRPHRIIEGICLNRPPRNATNTGIVLREFLEDVGK
jgi:hypothetical protein